MSSTVGDHPPELRVPAAARARSLPEGGLVTLLRHGRTRAAVDLAAGTPQAPSPPANLIEAACAALHAGVNQYEDPAGNIGLRSQIARSFHTPADPDTEITVTTGATEALHVALLSTVDAGDEVIVLEPYYDNFIGAIALSGAQPRFVRTQAPDWRVDPEELAAAFGPRTRAIILNTPANPTGRMLDADDLALIAGLCARWGVTVISDEVYSAFTFDGREHLSVMDVPELRDRAVVVGSLSKSHAISGWRIGFLRASPARTAVLREVHIATTGGTAAPLQHAVMASELLTPDNWNPAPLLQELRDRTVEIFTSAGLACTRPEGGCYVMADLGLVTDLAAHSFVDRMIDETGVLIVPGTYFYAEPKAGERFVRIAFNRPLETIEAAATRLDGWSAGGRRPVGTLRSGS